MTLTRTHYIAIAALVLVLAAACVLYGMRGGTVQPDAPPTALAPFTAAKAPVPVPQVAITDVSGARVMLSAFKGRYVLLNLWATWCAPCVRELPALAKLKTQLPADRFAVVAVDVGRGTAADAKAFLAGHGAGALDAYIDTDLALLRSFGAFGLPLTVLIDPQGREIGRAVGPAAWDSRESIDYFKALAAARAAS